MLTCHVGHCSGHLPALLSLALAEKLSSQSVLPHLQHKVTARSSGEGKYTVGKNVPPARCEFHREMTVSGCACVYRGCSCLLELKFVFTTIYHCFQGYKYQQIWA